MKSDELHEIEPEDLLAYLIWCKKCCQAAEQQYYKELKGE